MMLPMDMFKLLCRTSAMKAARPKSSQP